MNIPLEYNHLFTVQESNLKFSELASCLVRACIDESSVPLTVEYSGKVEQYRSKLASLSLKELAVLPSPDSRHNSIKELRLFPTSTKVETLTTSSGNKLIELESWGTAQDQNGEIGEGLVTTNSAPYIIKLIEGDPVEIFLNTK